MLAALVWLLCNVCGPSYSFTRPLAVLGRPRCENVHVLDMCFITISLLFRRLSRDESGMYFDLFSLTSIIFCIYDL